MRITGTFEYRDAKLGITLFELDYEASVSLVWDNGEPVTSCDAVYVESTLADEPGWKLTCEGDALTVAIGEMIAAKVEADDTVLSRLTEDEGVSYRSRGANDPRGYWRIGA